MHSTTIRTEIRAISRNSAKYHRLRMQMTTFSLHTRMQTNRLSMYMIQSICHLNSKQAPLTTSKSLQNSSRKIKKELKQAAELKTLSMCWLSLRSLQTRLRASSTNKIEFCLELQKKNEASKSFTREVNFLLKTKHKNFLWSSKTSRFTTWITLQSKTSLVDHSRSFLTSLQGIKITYKTLVTRCSSIWTRKKVRARCKIYKMTQYCIHSNIWLRFLKEKTTNFLQSQGQRSTPISMTESKASLDEAFYSSQATRGLRLKFLRWIQYHVTWRRIAQTSV